jgi:hypothetical protein
MNVMTSEIMKFNQFIVFSIILIFIFAFTYYLHMNYLSVSVVLYATIIDLLVSILVTVIIFKIIFKKNWSYFLKPINISIILCFISIGINFCILVPTLIDRSLSVYFLEKIYENNGKIKIRDIDEMIINKFFLEKKLGRIRIEEQRNSSTLYVKNNTIYLTEFGFLVVKFTKWFSSNLLPKKRNIYNLK